MIVIKEVENLFKYFYISDWAFCYDKLFGIEIDISSDFGEATSLPDLGLGTILNTVIISKAFAMSSAEFA